MPVLNYVIGVTLFDEYFSISSAIGSLIVIGSCVVVLLKTKNSTEDKS